MLSVKNVHKTFGNVKALKGISFDVKKGDIFGLIGPNGSGKTTTIRIILSIIYPDKGEIEMGFKRIGYMPEDRGLYPDMQINELIYFLGRLKGMDRVSIEKQMNFWLGRFELSERKKDKVKTLSKGLNQRLHLLISVIHDPELLILDEPFIGLDPIAIKGLRELIVELKDRGKTVLLSTHWMEQAEQLCESICLIKDGKKIYSGSLETLRKKHTKNEIYIEFEGKINFNKFQNIKVVKKQGKGFIIFTEKEIGNFIRELTEVSNVKEFRTIHPSLEKIFIQEVGGE